MPDRKVMVDLVEYDGGCRDTVGDGGYEQHYQAASRIFFLSSFNGRCQRVNEENGFLV